MMIRDGCVEHLKMITFKALILLLSCLCQQFV